MCRLWNLAGGRGLRAGAPVGEGGAHKPPSSLATGGAVLCLVCCGGRERAWPLWGTLSHYGRVPPQPPKKCPQTHWATVPTAAPSLSPEGAAAWGARPRRVFQPTVPGQKHQGEATQPCCCRAGPRAPTGGSSLPQLPLEPVAFTDPAELPVGLSLEAVCAGRPPSPATGHQPRGPEWEGQMCPAQHCLRPSCSRLARIRGGRCHQAPGSCRFKDHTLMCWPPGGFWPLGAAGQHVRPVLTGVCGCVWGRGPGQVSVW